MDDFKRFPKTQTRQLIDFNRFMSLTGDKIFICLDRGVMEIMRYLLNTRGSWRSTYVKEYVGTVGYMMPTEEEFNAVQDAIGEANIDMSSCDDLVNALLDIKAAIVDLSGGGGCGCGSSGAGGSEAGADPWSPGGDPDAYPPGFASKEDYDGHKCRAAAKIVGDIIADLQSISVISIAGLTLTAIAGLILAVLATPVPFDDILVIAGVLLFSVLSVSNIANLSSDLNDAYDDLVCALLNGEDASESMAGIMTVIQDVIADMGLSSPEESALNTIAASVVTFDAINRLYEPGAQYEIDYTCNCGPDTEGYTVVYGVETSDHPANPIEAVMASATGYLCGSDARHFGVSFDAAVTVDSIVALGNGPGACGQDIYYYYSDDSFTTLISSGNTPPQIGGSVAGVQSVYVLLDDDGNSPTVELSYTI